MTLNMRMASLAAVLAAVIVTPTSFAASWTSPADISPVTADTNSGDDQAIAVDGTGNWTSAWLRASDVGQNGPKAFQSSTGAFGAWGPFAAVSPEYQAGDWPDGPLRLVVDRAGVGTMVWTKNDSISGNNLLWAQRRVGGVWSAPEPISDVGYDVGNPALGVDASGVVTAVWVAMDSNYPYGQVIKARRFTGGAWAPIEVVSTEPDPDLVVASGPALAVAPSGATEVVWQADDYANRVIKARRWEPTSGWSPATGPLSYPTLWAGTPAVAIDDSGVATATWALDLGSTRVLQARRTDAAGEWPDPVVDLSDPASYLNYQDVASAPGGTVTVAWVEGPQYSDQVVNVRRLAGASGWSPTTTISGADVVPRSGVQAVTTDTGRSTVAWQESGSRQTIRARQSSPSGEWPTPAQLVSGDAVDNYTPRLAADGAGAVGAVWQAGTGSGDYRVRSSFLASTPGAPTGASGTAGDGTVAASWTAPRLDGGAAIASYRVTASPGGATCTSAAPATTCTLSGLANGTAYTFTVAAVNAEGTGPESQPSAPVTPSAPATPATPAAPTSDPASVRRLRALTQCRGVVCTTTGTVPAGATRIVQQAASGATAAARGAAQNAMSARQVRGTCSMRRAGGHRVYRCSIRLAPGRWVLGTRAVNGATVVARASRRVSILRVRPVTG